jgi:hypothetical protein
MPDGVEDVKLIGVYSSAESAEQAKLRLCNQPGFRDLREGFSIEPYTVDTDHWTEGIISCAEAMRMPEEADG